MLKWYPLRIFEKSEDNKNKNKINITDTLKSTNRIEIPITKIVNISIKKSVRLLKAYAILSHSFFMLVIIFPVVFVKIIL